MVESNARWDLRVLLMLLLNTEMISRLYASVLIESLLLLDRLDKLLLFTFGTQRPVSKCLTLSSKLDLVELNAFPSVLVEGMSQ
jgi:hypothetical protein